MRSLEVVDHRSYSLKRLTHSDIPKIVQLSAKIGWDYTVADVTTIFEAGSVFGHKTVTGQLISSAAIFPYGDGEPTALATENTVLASIGAVIVNPDYRGAGLGREVTQACISSLPSKPVIILVATEQGIPLYEKMGFITADRLYKLIAQKVKPPHRIDKIGTYRYREYEPVDFEQVIQLDQAAFGAYRGQLLETRIQQSQKQAVLVNSVNEIVGFGLGINVSGQLLIGPLVAPNHEAAELLVQKLIADHPGQARIDLPSDKHAFVKTLELYGFEAVNEPPVMVLHALGLPNRNGALYAIAAQAFG